MGKLGKLAQQIQFTFKHNYRSGAKTRVSRNKSRQNGNSTTSNLRMVTPSYVPRLLMEPTDTTTIVEETSFNLTSSATGTLSNLINMNLNNVTAFASQFLTIYDEWRLLQVQFKYHSRVGSNTSGAIVIYLERDNSDVAVTTLSQAYRQQESQEFRPWDDFVTSPKLTTLQWKPKDPSDSEYQASAGLEVFRFVAVGENLPISTLIGSIQVLARIQFRGRTTAT